MQEALIVFIGLITVFFVFTILFIIFKLFGFFSKKATVKLPKKLPVREKVKDKEEEIAAVIAAVYAMLGNNVKIISVKKINRRKYGKREWEYWKKSGWRGVKEW
ncbi:OadG family protein [Thermosipho atlanticus]|uniref:Oxaloacetate decarboxylase, gamma chain n=1 Tax=Thermosipho atlanticus DSM 15807 TaxID=1123380 RepID=A0A1M5QLV5_9BACT|nr:OadG family protein [Thermosipho atlanticus]SHH14936.1 Oxaloacetate decarboxylase, gamma chain [Thermosipho atlanticus DSM 15807]